MDGPSMDRRTTTERKSDRELIVTRTFDAPVRIVFEAWSKPDLFMRWWAPKSMGVPLLSCEMDVRAGGKYRLEFGRDSSRSAAFFGNYLEDGAVTTETFDEQDGKTLVVFSELYPSKEALDEAFTGMDEVMPEQFE